MRATESTARLLLPAVSWAVARGFLTQILLFACFTESRPSKLQALRRKTLSFLDRNDSRYTLALACAALVG